MFKLQTKQSSSFSGTLLTPEWISYGGITYTESMATQHIEKAKAALDTFENVGPKEILEDIADYALVRNV